VYRRIYSTKCPASGAGKVSEPRLMSQVRTVRVDQCVPADRWRCQYSSAYVANAIV